MTGSPASLPPSPPPRCRWTWAPSRPAYIQAQRAERRPQRQAGGHRPRRRRDRDLCGPRQRRGGLRRAVQEASGRCQGLGEHRAGRGGQDRAGGHCHRGEQGRHRGVRQGRAGVRPRLSERSAPRRRPVLPWCKQKVQLRDHRGQPQPAAAWWAPSAAVTEEARKAAQEKIWAEHRGGQALHRHRQVHDLLTACSWTSAAWTAWYISPS